MKILTNLITNLVDSFADSISELGEKDHSLKASYSKKNSLLSPRHSGFAIGLDAFTSEQAHSHVMCCAPS